MAEQDNLKGDTAVDNAEAASTSQEGGLLDLTAPANPGTQETQASPAPVAQGKADGEAEPKSLLEGANNGGNVEDVVPEQYEFKLPEGVVLDDVTLNDLGAYAKENKLTAKQADIVANAMAVQMEKLRGEHIAWQKEQVELWNKDPQVDTNKLHAMKALKHFGLEQYVSERGYDFDATLMKAFAKVGTLISEAKAVTGGEAVTGTLNPYANSPEFK